MAKLKADHAAGALALKVGRGDVFRRVESFIPQLPFSVLGSQRLSKACYFVSWLCIGLWGGCANARLSVNLDQGSSR